MIGIGVMFFQQFNGINALIYYSPTLFSLMGMTFNLQLILSGLLNMVQLLAIMTNFWTIDLLGRRPLLLIGSLTTLASHGVIAILVAKFSGEWSTHRLEGWVSVAALFSFMFFFGASWGPVAWTIPAE